MKKLLIIFSISLLILNACNSKDGESSNNGGAISSILPSSTGGADEIMFVIPDKLYTDGTKELINTNFNEAYKILPKPENTFNISNIKFSALNGLMYRYRNIVLIADINEESGVLAKAKEVLSDEQFEQLKNGEQQVFALKNIWSKPQNVIFIFGKGNDQLQANMEKYARQVKDKILKSDLEVYKTIAFLPGINGVLKKQWKEYHNIDLNIPADFKLASNEGNFVSLRKDYKEGMIFIFFDVINYSGDVPDANYGIKLRNERGKFVNSANYDNTYVTTDSTLGFVETKTIKDNIITYETDGLWSMENDFMGGPFINKYIIDQDNDRVILLDGFMYAPGEDKKKRYMRQLEAIFSTLEIGEAK